jgi:DNA-binding NarL/FixJ family response regulator
MRVVIIDDHEIVREGLRATLSRDPDIEVVGEAGSGLEGLREVGRLRPRVALVDLRLPDTSGFAVCKQIVAKFPRTAVVILTTYLSEDAVRRCTEAGARGYVTKAAGLRELRRVLHSVVGGGTMHTGGAADTVSRLHHVVTQHSGGGAHSLTPQQQRILELAVSGMTYRQIGERLFIAESTVRWHIQGLKTRLGVRSKAELIAYVIRSAMIAPGHESVRG